MVSIENTLAGDHLVVGSRRIKADIDGDFIVPRQLFGDDDLSAIPAGITIIVDNSKMPGRTEDHPDRVRAIEVLPMGRVSVRADYYRCPCCWTNSLDFEKFNAVLIQLFKKEAAVNSGFQFEGTDFTWNREPLQCFTIEVGIGSIAKIERRVHDACKQILRPVYDMIDEINARTQKAFGL